MTIRASMTEAERLFEEWRSIDPGCDPGLSPTQLRRVLCFAEYVRTKSTERPANRDRTERDELLAALKALVAESMTTEMLFADERPKGWKPPELEKARALITRLELLR